MINDIAFLAMDLESKSRPDLAAWLVNAYLEASGDYAGLPLLRFYEVYRAMVRAKVAVLRLHQTSLAARPHQAAGRRVRAATSSWRGGFPSRRTAPC